MIAYILEAIASSILYRMGGTSLGTKWRDFGCPIVVLLAFYLNGMLSIWAILACVLLFGALTTYWDWLFGEDELGFHGLVCGLAMFPLCFAGVAWWQIVAYASILGIVMGGLNWAVHKFHVKHSDWIEKLSRGAVIILAIPVLL